MLRMMKANNSMNEGDHKVPHLYNSCCDVAPLCVDEEEKTDFVLNPDFVRDAIIAHYGNSYGGKRRDDLLVALGLEPVNPPKRTYRVVFEYDATEKSKTLRSLGLPDNAYIISHEEA
jgi:hypothetical protein